MAAISLSRTACGLPMLTLSVSVSGNGGDDGPDEVNERLRFDLDRSVSAAAAAVHRVHLHRGDVEDGDHPVRAADGACPARHHADARQIVRFSLAQHAPRHAYRPGEIAVLHPA